MEFSRDGRRMVTASTDFAAHFTAQVWDVVSGRSLGKPLPHAYYVTVASFSPDASRVVTASQDKTARVWDAVTGEAVTPALAHSDNVNRAEFSPDGQKVITASADRTARVWAVEDGRPLLAIQHGGKVVSAQFRSDGRRVLTASLEDGLVLVSDADSGQIEHQFKFGSRVNSARFSPDGARIAVIHSDYSVTLQDLPSRLNSIDKTVPAAPCPGCRNGECPASAKLR
jgi:WD40 repeat protein